MGQEITLTEFEAVDFIAFRQKLAQETALLKQMIDRKSCSNRQPVAGFEIEAWLVDAAMRPAPVNQQYLATLNDPLASAELAKFNFELNCEPAPLTDNVFSLLHAQLERIWQNAGRHAESMNHSAVMIGILPTLAQSDLHLGNMSDMHRYKALNEQILQARGKPIHIDISGTEHLKIEHHDVMLESATTSFQTHIQLPLDLAHHFYNASIIASAAVVAISANSPFLFGRELWHETRIPLFEQAVETGGYAGAARGPLHRVSFGSGYLRHSVIECFEENLAHFPVLLPVTQDTDAASFTHLRLHNGTIWRWNRPLVGFDADGTPHLRIEHRTPASGPTPLDAIANAAFYFGLTQNICEQICNQGLPLTFPEAKDNFYLAARHGLDGTIVWFDGARHRMDHLLRTELLPRAFEGLKPFGVSASDIGDYLDIIRQRLANKQNGSDWQRRYAKEHQRDFVEMTRTYLKNQSSGKPVGEWQ
ncbi:glutamate--cysteine ligase [Methylomicrobium sp. Wu6]|uniref:glutamate--cysteine ligase n=1 Tax=Methylomicrobium sp. Wu6 TaxID=3107928 RepID=UPI002DD67B67|nr:glutamate--cysteine ligase [Methylomicrobium sp. Wu6]MEC4749529.1 glutamate--cysteine ligase [Methylomicrobium sp. Wu6]